MSSKVFYEKKNKKKYLKKTTNKHTRTGFKNMYNILIREKERTLPL